MEEIRRKHRKSSVNVVAGSKKTQKSEAPTSGNRHLSVHLNSLLRGRAPSKSASLPYSREDAPSRAKPMSISSVANSINALFVTPVQHRKTVDVTQRQSSMSVHGVVETKEKLKKANSTIEGASEGKTEKTKILPISATCKRRSYCNTRVELADFFSCNGVKVVAADMPPFMQIHAVDCARKSHDSLEKFTSKTLALALKKEFDAVYGPAWHCIVGTSFGSFVTHSVGGFLYFSMDRKLYVLLFKTTVQRADQVT